MWTVESLPEVSIASRIVNIERKLFEDLLDYQEINSKT